MAQRRSKRVRLVDIAAKAGVSPSVVSAVVRGGTGHGARFGSETEDRVRKIIRELNYQPNVAARMLKGKRSNIIGVLIGATAEPVNYGRLSAMELEAYNRGYRLMIGQFRDDPRHTADYIEDFLSRGVDGLMIFHYERFTRNEQVLDALRTVRHLVCQHQSVVETASSVDVDRVEAIRQVVHHLHATGRRRIGLMLGALTTRPMTDRQRGYGQALAQLKLSTDPNLLWYLKDFSLDRYVPDSRGDVGGWTWTPSKTVIGTALDQVVDDARADAIIASNDVWAIEIIKALRRRGKRVPDDVAVVGFDNLMAGALFDPALTTVDQNNPAFAKAAMDLFEESLDTQLAPRHIVVEPHLVVRESA